MSKKIIEYWYRKLDFPKEYDKEFFEILEKVHIPTEYSIEDYDVKSEDGAANLLSVLYLCESVSEKYKKMGIDEDILSDTLKDIVRWTQTYSDIHKKLFLGELAWIKHHLSMNIFKIGRLQFCKEKFSYDIPERGIKKGDYTIGIHIPADGVLDEGECLESVDKAREFFDKFYPEFKYSYFKCHSWLLDKKLETVLKSDSNILKFQNMFDIVSFEPSDAILRYVFKWNTTRENLKDADANTTLAKKVKEKVLGGEKFNEAMGLIKK